MAIYAVGAYYDGDVSDDFITNNIAGGRGGAFQTRPSYISLYAR